MVFEALKALIGTSIRKQSWLRDEDVMSAYLTTAGDAHEMLCNGPTPQSFSSPIHESDIRRALVDLVYWEHSLATRGYRPFEIDKARTLGFRFGISTHTASVGEGDYVFDRIESGDGRTRRPALELFKEKYYS